MRHAAKGGPSSLACPLGGENGLMVGAIGRALTTLLGVVSRVRRATSVIAI